MKMSVISGATIAAAAAAFIVAGAVNVPTTASAAMAKGKCFGVNACKGQSACKTAKSECKGLNNCKGQGFKEMTKSQCTKAKGKFQKA